MNDRIILFRGKRLDNGEWVGGNLVLGKPYKGMAFIYEMFDDPESCTFYTVDPNTVGQFTGLLDKNGKRIFEGDKVLLGSKNFPRVIEWHIIGLRAKQIDGDANFPLHYPFVGQTGNETDWEIIGNIHDNK